MYFRQSTFCLRGGDILWFFFCYACEIIALLLHLEIIFNEGQREYFSLYFSSIVNYRQTELTLKSKPHDESYESNESVFFSENLISVSF